MKRLFAILILAAVLFAACADDDGAGSSVVGPSYGPEAGPMIDSLKGVIDTLEINLARHRCLVECLKSTLDSNGIAPHCECGL